MGRLRGRTALVTGGSRGIGRATSRALAREGALVAVHYGRDAQAAEETVAMIAGDDGEAFAVGSLLGEDGDVQRLFAAVDVELEGRRGSSRLDIVVNNAGIATAGPLADVSPADFDELVAINTRAPLFVSQAAAERMGEGGRIISIGSAVTHKAWPEALAYTMSKGAIEVMTRTMAKDLAPRGITVNAIGAGLIDTELNPWLHSSEEVEALAASYSAFDRVGQPDDVADVVVFLASDESRWITGQQIDVSGGTNL
jgi:3-oxoacyl-[acyl-carrier protein] reductase